MGATNPDTPTTYRCPHCGETYEDERLTRVHITRASDGPHRNRNGQMPETDIEVVDEDGTVVDTITKRPSDIDLESLGPEDLPDDHKLQHKWIIIIAARHPHVESYTELEERAETVLPEHGEEIPSYSTIRRVIRDFFRPGESEQATNSESTGSEEQLSDLTEKQQAVVIAHLADPDATNTTIADRVGVAHSYPTQVLTRAADVIDRLERRVEQNDALDEVLADDLTAADVTALRNGGYLDAVDIDLTDQFDTLDPQADPNDPRDRPVTEQRNVMSASPYSNGSSLPTDASAPESTHPTTGPGLESSRPDGGTNQKVDNIDSGSVEVTRADLITLRDCVSFARQIGSHMDNELDWQRALACVVETELEQLLKEH